MVDHLIKMIYHTPVKTMIDTVSLAKIIIHVVVRYHGFPELIVSNRVSLLISKFCSLLYYFLDIKRKLSNEFHPQTDGYTERQNKMIKVYLHAFVNWKRNDWTKLLPMAKFVYKNAKNARTGHTFFKLNCRYHLHVFFKDETDFCSRSRSVNKLAKKLKNLILICQQNSLHTWKL